MIEMKAGLAGYVKMVAVDAATGRERLLADWFPNLILDSGLELIGTHSQGATGATAYCQVGTSSAAVNSAQTALISRIAGTVSSTTENGAQATLPYYGWTLKKYRFGAGVAAGNLSEVAVAPAATGPTFNRALILDDVGTPTTITVLSNEFLDVYYELRAYPPLTDVVFSTNISGQAHDCVLRASQVTSQIWAPSAPFSGSIVAFNGVLGAITGFPSGAVASAAGSPTIELYSAGSLWRDKTQTFALPNGNVVGGISAIQATSQNTWIGCYQCSFDPPIAKDATNQLTLTFRTAWSRYTP